MASRRTARWTIGFDAWGGVPVRLHLLMVLFAVATLSLTLGGDDQTAGLLLIAVLISSVVLHEAAHCLAAVRLGGAVDEVVLTPIGGLRAPRVPDEPEPQVFVALVGPMLNLALVVMATAALVYAREPQILPLFNPVSPTDLTVGSTPRVAMKMVLWINSTLFLLNLIPAYPFDGGPALRAILWPMLGRRSAAVASAQTARLVAAGLLLAAGVMHKAEPMAVMPLWAPLVTLAVFVLFSAQQDLRIAYSMDASQDTWRSSHHADGDDTDSLDWFDPVNEMVLVEHGGDSRQLRREAQQMADEAYEDARVDDILARMHSGGYENLSEEERRVLERASRRYRYRRQAEDEVLGGDDTPGSNGAGRSDR